MATPDAARGIHALQTRALRKDKERSLANVVARVDMLAAEEARIKKVIAETKSQLMAHKQVELRVDVLQKAKDLTKGWVEEEEVQRRQANQETRRQNREAVSQRRFALLKQRHDDFLLKKKETEEGRAAIIAARALKLEQARLKKATLLKQHEVAVSRNHVRAKAQEQALEAHAAIDRAEEAAAMRATAKRVQQLAAEEERLLSGALKAHAVHQQAFTEVRQGAGGHVLGLTNAPATYALSGYPKAPDNVMLSRRPGTVPSMARPTTPRGYGNSVAGSPRSHSPRFTARPPASARADLMGAGLSCPPMGRACMMSSPSVPGEPSSRPSSAVSSRPASAVRPMAALT